MEFSKASALRSDRARSGLNDPSTEMRDRAPAPRVGGAGGLPRWRDDTAGKTTRDRGGQRWVVILILDLVLLLIPIPLVVGVPPVLACRETQSTIGFFAGDSFGACAERGIRARWQLMEARVKMMVRGSGY